MSDVSCLARSSYVAAAVVECVLSAPPSCVNPYMKEQFLVCSAADVQISQAGYVG